MDLVVAAVTDEYAGSLTTVRTDITRCPAATGRYWGHRRPVLLRPPPSADTEGRFSA